MKYTVAILYICTGKYDIFWKDFFESMETFFLPDSEKHYYVFTDAEYLYDEENCDRIHKIHQERLGWPYDTLMRFDIFSKIQEQLKIYDYIFFFNANMLCVKTITEEEFLPINEELLVVRHPGYINYPKLLLPYERNKKSTAYVKWGHEQQYFMGSLNGGRAEAYVRLINCLQKEIQKDLERNVIAKWHDESQLNKYALERKNVKVLSPAYAYPENWKISYEPKILIRDKDKMINTSEIKGYNSFWVDIKKKVRKKLPL